LVKTSDQPSFSSANFSPFTSAEALRSSDISPVPSLNLKPNPRGGTAKKITSSPYKKFVEATFPFADDSTEEVEEQDADCVFCTGRVSEDHNGENWIRCAKFFRWAHKLCAGMEEYFVCEPCQG